MNRTISSTNNPEKNYKGYINTRIVQTVVSITVFVAAFHLYYMQIVNPDSFDSDISAHLRFAMSERGYSYLMPVLSLCFRIFGPYGNAAVAALEAMIQVGTLFLTKRLVLCYRKMKEIQAFFLSVICFFYRAYISLFFSLYFTQAE